MIRLGGKGLVIKVRELSRGSYVEGGKLYRVMLTRSGARCIREYLKENGVPESGIWSLLDKEGFWIYVSRGAYVSMLAIDREKYWEYLEFEMFSNREYLENGIFREARGRKLDPVGIWK